MSHSSIPMSHSSIDDQDAPACRGGHARGVARGRKDDLCAEASSHALPLREQIALIRGLLEEGKPPSCSKARAPLIRMTGIRFLAGLTIWGFALYGVWSFVT